MNIPDRSDREGWWAIARDIYERHRKPEWRVGLPKGTPAKSQSILFALMYQSPHGIDERDTGRRMQVLLEGWGRWLEGHQGTGRTTLWTALEQYCTGPGALKDGSPEQAVRDALRSVPRDVALRLVLRLACEYAEGVPRR